MGVFKELLSETVYQKTIFDEVKAKNQENLVKSIGKINENNEMSSDSSEKSNFIKNVPKLSAETVPESKNSKKT